MTESWFPSRYGADDVLGAGNELTSERTLAALRLPRSGEVIPLAPVLEDGGVVIEPRLYHQIVLAHGRMVDGSFGFEEHISATMHIGCHLDALGHAGIGERFYNGHHQEEMFSPHGLLRLGVENAPAWICRGVCLDLSKAADEEMLPEGFEVTAAHLEAACDRQGVKLEAGDAVLLHTGWSGIRESDPEKYAGNEPGPGLEAAVWLTERRVSLVGADNWALEWIAPGSAPGPVHQELLTRTGTYIVENMETAPLAERGASEFLFAMTPLRVKGATGSMVAPTAVL